MGGSWDPSVPMELGGLLVRERRMGWLMCGRGLRGVRMGRGV